MTIEKKLEEIIEKARLKPIEGHPGLYEISNPEAVAQALLASPDLVIMEREKIKNEIMTEIKDADYTIATEKLAGNIVKESFAKGMKWGFELVQGLLELDKED